MELFMPTRAFFEPGALDYPLGSELYDRLKAKGIPIRITPSHNRVLGIPGETPQIAYREAKRTLVVGVKKVLKLDSCRPSADYEFALGTSCPGGCQYCYLATTLGRKPYVRIYVNVDEILAAVKDYIDQNRPAITSFEAASTADPLAVEHLTGSLQKTINFFGRQEYGRLRVVTKFANVDGLLATQHRGHTKFRFSINSAYVIKTFEAKTAPLTQRLAAAGKIAAAGYPLGFIIAPLFLYKHWQADYRKLLEDLAVWVQPHHPPSLSFELISHRFTARAKKVILERFPHTQLEMNEEKRKLKWGKYGYGKYLYPPDQLETLKNWFTQEIGRLFPQAEIEYFT
ncbi:MAG TPA: spore photoproduct lyase [Firmicutes bacterium]|jgi:spore photoproduct lyase|nr:spore photoproduct lyase [Bacillota bacterium]